MILCNALKKIVIASQSHPTYGLFGLSYKIVAQNKPFKLVYRQEALILDDFLVPSVYIVVQERWDVLPSNVKKLRTLNRNPIC